MLPSSQRGRNKILDDYQIDVCGYVILDSHFEDINKLRLDEVMAGSECEGLCEVYSSEAIGDEGFRYVIEGRGSLQVSVFGEGQQSGIELCARECKKEREKKMHGL